MTLAAQHLDEAQWAFDSYERMYGLCGEAPPFSELFAEAHPECSVASKVVRWGLEFLDGSALWLNDGLLEVEWETDDVRGHWNPDNTRLHV